MAMSKSYPVGQFAHIIQCGLCDNEDVNWFCKHCVKYLCDDCKKMHAKIPSCENHDIGTVGDGKVLQDKSSILCKEHGEPMQYLCKSCDSVEVCLKCAGGEHRKHDLENIADVVDAMRKGFSETMKSLAASRSELENAREELKKKEREFHSTIDSARSDIVQRYEEIRKLKDGLIHQLEVERDRGQTQFEKGNTALIKSSSEIDAVMQDAQAETDQLSGLPLVRCIKGLKEKQRTIYIPKKLTIPKSPKYSATISTEQLKRSYGVVLARGNTELQMGGRKHGKLMDEIWINKEFRHNQNFLQTYVYGISIVGGNKAWVAAKGMSLQLIDKTGKVENKITTASPVVFSTITPDGDLLISHGSYPPLDSTIKRIGKCGCVSTFADLSPSKAVFGLVSFKEGDVMCIDMVDDVHKITKLSSDGKKMWTVDVGKINSSDRTLCLGQDGNAYFLSKPKILTVSSAGHITTLCNLEHSDPKHGPITRDSFGNFIIGGQNGTIDVYDTDGKRKRHYQISRKEGIHALTTDDDN